MSKKLIFSAIVYMITLVACSSVDDPITISTADLNLSVDENPLVGDILGTVSGTTSSGTVTFSILSQTSSGAVAIDSGSGELTVADASAFDFETASTITITVEVINGTISDESIVTVNVQNVLETVGTQDETVSIDEHPTSGDLVVTAMGTTDLGSVTFSLLSESVTGAFSINSTSGELTVGDASAFDFETNATLTATVNVINSTLEQNAAITVNLNDISESVWTEVNSDVAFGGVYDHQIVEFDNALWMIGGIKGTTRTNEVWTSTDGNSWTQVTTSSTMFSPRNGHQAIVFKNKIWVVGGITEHGRTNDVWNSFDGQNWEPVTTSSVFSARSDHSTVVFNNKLWVIAGSDGNPLDDVWSTTDGVVWTPVSTNGTIFSPRMGQSAVVFNHLIWLIGGADLDGQNELRYNNDVWFSQDGIHWDQMTVSGSQFSERWLHNVVVYNNQLWVLNGDDGDGNRFNDIWVSSGGREWSRLTAVPEFEERDNAAAFTFNGKLWFSGGSSGTGVLSDIWKSN